MSLTKGETKFTTPSRANEIGSYVNPLNQMAVRGIFVWNILFPSEEITLPTNVNLCKLEIPIDPDGCKERIEDYCNEYNIFYSKKDLDDFIEKLKEVFNFSVTKKVYNQETRRNEDVVEEQALVKGGLIDIISLPKNATEIPLFLRPFINSEKMSYDLINSGTIILDCINVQTPKINNSLIPTNIIRV